MEARSPLSTQIGADAPAAGLRPLPIPVQRPHHTGYRARRLVTAAVLLAAAVALPEVWLHTRATPSVHYATAEVSRGSVARAVTGSGTVNPVTTIQVGTYVSGVIQELFCDYNTKVTKGQPCAKIDPRPYQTVVDQELATNTEVAAGNLAPGDHVIVAEQNRNSTSGSRQAAPRFFRI